MPLYEYHCSACNKTFEKLLRQQEAEAPCPACGAKAPKTVSVFAASNCAAPAGSGFG